RSIMKIRNSIFASIALICFSNSKAQMNPVGKKKWVIQPTNQQTLILPNQWESFFKAYGFKATIGALTGATCGTSCALFEKIFHGGNVSLAGWILFGVINSSSVNGITEELKEHGIQDTSKIVGISATIGSWGSYILFKLLQGR
ncbi:MAG: hypothetical protein Q8Q25_02480, partial [bacterium]|nr:hypothetical protein [bacterium]